MSAERVMPGIALPEEQEPEPVREPFPRVVPGLREPRPEPDREPRPAPVPGPAAVPGTAADLVPAVAAPGQPIGTAEHLLLSLRDWAGRAAASQKRHRSFWHWIWHGFWNSQPESLSQHRRYLKSRQWLEDYMTGWLRQLIEWENITFGVLVARPVKAICNNISRAVERQSRSWITVTVLFLAFIVWKSAHH